MGRYLVGTLLVGGLAVFSAAMGAPPIEAYGRLPVMSDVSISPSGERYAFVAKVGEQRRLVVAGIDNKPIASSSVGDIKVRKLEWAGENHVLVFSTATVNIGSEFIEPALELATAIVLNVESHQVSQIFGTKRELRVANSVFGFYGTEQIGGHWFGWFGGVTYGHTPIGSYLGHGYPDLYKVDLDTGEIAIVAPGGDDIDGWLVGQEGAIVARSLYNQKSGNWQVLAGRDNPKVLAAGQNAFGGPANLHFGRSTGTLLLDLPTDATGGGFGAHEYREISLADGSDQPMPSGLPAGYPLFDRIDHHWIGNELESDNLEAVLIAPALEARRRAAIKAFPNYIVHLQSWSADFNKIIVLTEGGDDSGTYWIVDIEKHSADPIGASYPSVKAADVGPVRMVEWSAADGLQLHGVLTLPPGRAPKSLPVVVLPHRGPGSRDYPGFDWWAQAFASRGYAVFQPNFRGSGGYGKAFRNAGFGEWGRKMLTDISDGLANLAATGMIDSKRACIVGASYGGYAALAGVTVQQGLYRCAVSVAGVSDLQGLLNYQAHRGESSSVSVRFWKAFMGVTSTSNSGELRPINPIALAEKADAPILLIHGKDDTVVPLRQSEDMRSALERAGKPVEFVTMDNEDHWLSREASRIEMLKAAVAFVEKNNPAN